MHELTRLDEAAGAQIVNFSARESRIVDLENWADELEMSSGRTYLLVV